MEQRDTEKESATEKKTSKNKEATGTGNPAFAPAFPFFPLAEPLLFPLRSKCLFKAGRRFASQKELVAATHVAESASRRRKVPPL